MVGAQYCRLRTALLVLVAPAVGQHGRLLQPEEDDLRDRVTRLDLNERVAMVGKLYRQMPAPSRLNNRVLDCYSLTCPRRFVANLCKDFVGDIEPLDRRG